MRRRLARETEAVPELFVPAVSLLRVSSRPELSSLPWGGTVAERACTTNGAGIDDAALLVEREADDDDGGGPAPHEGHGDPEVVHGLGS